MSYYKGIIWFKDGHKQETGTFGGPGARESCERQTAQCFNDAMRRAQTPFFQPSRYEVVEVK